MKFPEYRIFETQHTLVGDKHLNNENREEGRKDSGRAADFLSFIILTRVSSVFFSFWGILHQLGDYAAHYHQVKYVPQSPKFYQPKIYSGARIHRSIICG
jgi:hypothetical protein